MAHRLTISEQGSPDEKYERSFIQDRVLFGRARSSDVCLPDMAVSTRHAEIMIKGSDYAIVDLGSVNGTRVNGRTVVAHRPRILRSGDIISVANFSIVFEQGVATPGTEPGGKGIAQAGQMLADILGRAGVQVDSEGQARSMRVIFEAPEESTSSFMAGTGAEADADEASDNESDVSGARQDIRGGSGEAPPPPVGPLDPLVAEPGNGPAGQPERPVSEDRSDIGLIFIGALVVIAAVVGLVYLFG